MYQGPRSCWARREGVFVARVGRPGIDTVAEAAGILYLILKDLRRGWTYDPDRSCRRIRMSEELFERRTRYVYTLANKHGASRHALAAIDRLVQHVISEGRLPKRIKYRGKYYSVESLINKVLAKVAA